MNDIVGVTDLEAGLVIEEPVVSEAPSDDGDAVLADILGDVVKPEDAPAAEPVARGPDGKFAKVDVDAPADLAQANPLEGYEAADREALAKLPAETQKFITERDAKFKNELTAIKTEHDEMRREATPYMQAVAKNFDYLQRVSSELKIPPHEIVSNIMQTERTLRYGTMDQKRATLAALAKDYGVDADSDALADPDAHDLQQQLADTRYQLSQFQRQQQSGAQAQYTTEIATFSAAKDATGTPLYPLFEQVRGPMGQLLESGKATSLADAYAKAVAPIEAEIERRSGAKSAAAKAEADRVAKARRAAPVRTSGSPRGTSQEKSLEEIVADAIG